MIELEKHEARRQAMIAASFTAFQLGAASENQTFESYIDGLGLGDTRFKMTKEEISQQIDQSLSIAERINAAVKAGKVTPDNGT